MMGERACLGPENHVSVIRKLWQPNLRTTLKDHGKGAGRTAAPCHEHNDISLLDSEDLERASTTPEGPALLGLYI